MDLDETSQGLRPEKTKPCTFPTKSHYGIGFRIEREKNGSRRRCFFLSREPRTTSQVLPLSLDRFPQNFPRTRVQVVSRDKWFHIPERFPLRDRISRKTLLLGYPIYAQPIRVTGNVLRRLHSLYPLVDIPQMYLS